MGAKIWRPGFQALSFTWDVAVQGGAVGTIALGNLPEGFVVTECWANARTALVGGGTAVVGQDGGGGDADGYFTNIDAIAVATPIRATGVLCTATSGLEAVYKVAAATDGVLVTVATTAYTEGVVDFIFIGFQG
jgi:hypothetical protein